MTITMLNPTTRSRFDWAYDSSVERSHAYFDQPIRETTNFVVLPSLGSIVQGWILVVPKIPVQTFHELPAALKNECNALVHEMRIEVKTRFGDVYIFEHGGGKGSPIACGVDQAHLHLAPLKFDLVSACQEERSVDWQRTCGFSLPFNSVQSSEEYLYAATEYETVIGYVKAPVSQWFRRLIASKTGITDSWNYREHPFHSNIQSTIRAFQGNVD